MRRKIFFLFALIAIVTAGWGYYLYKKPRTDISSLTAAVSLDATSLFAQFQKDEAVATKTFSDKIIEVNGIVDDVQQTDTTLSISLKATDAGAVNCSMASAKNNSVPQKGSQVTVKGRCTGYLIDVNLVDCVVTDKKR